MCVCVCVSVCVCVCYDGESPRILLILKGVHQYPKHVEILNIYYLLWSFFQVLELGESRSRVLDSFSPDREKSLLDQDLQAPASNLFHSRLQGWLSW